jgi:hypothetical protein
MAFTVVSLLADTTPSLAVKRSTYTPAIEKVAVVLVELGFPKVTLPGPLTSDHVVTNALLEMAEPFRTAAAGKMTVRLVPA